MKKVLSRREIFDLFGMPDEPKLTITSSNMTAFIKYENETNKYSINKNTLLKCYYNFEQKFVYESKTTSLKAYYKIRNKPKVNSMILSEVNFESITIEFKEG